MWVKNLEGTNKCKPPKGFSSWRHWWAVKKGCEAAEEAGTIPCSNISVQHGKRLADDGGHVCNVENPYDKHCYIVPLCDRCNHHDMTKPFEIKDGDMLEEITPPKGFEDEDEEEGVCICRDGYTCD